MKSSPCYGLTPFEIQRRYEALKGVPTIESLDRDEYVPAVFEQGGAGSHIEHIPPRDNRGSGSFLGHKLDGLNDGDWVELVPIDDTVGKQPEKQQ